MIIRLTVGATAWHHSRQTFLNLGAFFVEQTMAETEPRPTRNSVVHAWQDLSC